jgi:hypothetical protein
MAQNFLRHEQTNAPLHRQLSKRVPESVRRRIEERRHVFLRKRGIGANRRYAAMHAPQRLVRGAQTAESFIGYGKEPYIGLAFIDQQRR